MSLTHVGGLVLLLLTLWGASASAQDQAPPCPWPGPAEFLARRPSPPDSASLRLGDAVLKVCYSRPQARGRVVMGELLPFGRLWRTGANEPTLIFLPVAVEIAGAALEPGRYLLISIPQADQWTFLFHSAEGTTPQEMKASP